jgi:hypothetical protein
MSTATLDKFETTAEEMEIERLKAENAALKMALSMANRDRDEWRIVAEQCGYLGGEVGEAAKTVEKL